MRSDSDAKKIKRFFEELGKRARGAGRVYITGGTSAVLIGWRLATVDIDIKLDPEPPGAFEAIRDLKEILNANVELASPDQFIPALPGWELRSQYICSYNKVDFYHYDFYSQALSKIERGHQRDIFDVNQMLASKLINSKRLWELFQQIEPLLIRYPHINPEEFRKKVEGIIHAV